MGILFSRYLPTFFMAFSQHLFDSLEIDFFLEMFRAFMQSTLTSGIKSYLDFIAILANLR